MPLLPSSALSPQLSLAPLHALDPVTVDVLRLGTHTPYIVGVLSSMFSCLFCNKKKPSPHVVSVVSLMLFFFFFFFGNKISALTCIILCNEDLTRCFLPLSDGNGSNSSLPEFVPGILETVCHKVDGLEAGDGVLLDCSLGGVEGAKVRLICQTILAPKPWVC